MNEPSPDPTGQLWRRLRGWLLSAWALVRAAVSAVWTLLRPPLLAMLQILAALIVLFEEWGWRPLAALLGQLARFRPWAAMELWIAGLPPYGALMVFALPTTILFPLKLAAMWLLANGQFFAASALFIGAKIASTAFIARIFMLTKPALMQIGWFAWAYNIFMPWKEALFEKIRASWAWRYGRMVKTRIKHEAKRVWAAWGPQLAALGLRLRDWARTQWATVRPDIARLAHGLRVRWRALRMRYFGQSR